MSDFCASKLIDAIETYFKADRHIKERGYSPPIGAIRAKAKAVMADQVKVYKAELAQVRMKIG